MTLLLMSLSIWFHALATVIFLGHFVLLAGICIPALSKNGPALSDISKRSRPWLYISLIVFIVTGTYLMLIDPGYLGFMDFGNFWGIVMLLKHVLVIAMIGMGFWNNVILRVGPMMSSNNPEQAIIHFRKYVNAMAICGVLILFLTALAQVQ